MTKTGSSDFRSHDSSGYKPSQESPLHHSTPISENIKRPKRQRKEMVYHVENFSEGDDKEDISSGVVISSIML